MSANSLLQLTDGVAGYRQKCVLDGVALEINESDAIGIIGYNGAGKTTLLRILAGAQPLWSGHLSIRGELVPAGSNLRYFINRGIVYIPAGGRIFGALSVLENLKVVAPTRADLDSWVQILPKQFPDLATKLNRPAVLLSGGERQLLAIASVLLLSPKILLMDEPMLGLAPQAAVRVAELITRLRSETRFAFVATSQRPESLGAAITKAHLLRNGSIQRSGTPQEIAAALGQD